MLVLPFGYLSVLTILTLPTDIDQQTKNLKVFMILIIEGVG
jgi:hypothetical protein